MDWMYLIYFLLGMLLFCGAKICRKGEWNEEYTSFGQMKILQGATVLLISFHHMAQKTCAPWHESRYIVHGLDLFVPMGYLFCAVFLFCSGYGLYRSLKTKPGYLKHFIRRRILPVIAAYYLSEIIYLAVRVLMGEKTGALDIIWYLSGLHMANFNAWYIIAIIFFYFVFYFSFRFCRKERTAILLVFAAALLYTAGGALIDHQNDWFMRGEWWYNSIILFPAGLLFAKHEKKITAFFKKGYIVWLILSFAGIFVAYRLSQYLNGSVFGYYGENWGDPLKVLHRLGSCAGEWLVCICYVAFNFLLLMKVKLGNRALVMLGGVTLEFYLMHGIFVELFGYDFLEYTKSLVYIRSVPLYIIAVLACAAAATVLFRLLLKALLKAPLFKVPEDNMVK
ncbi:MAG: hypothetical protein CW338_05630 [Clostridiales bacterium]|nr:hypothetical protein [Clostridiales bacterium]